LTAQRTGHTAPTRSRCDLKFLFPGGEASFFHPRSHQWIARQIPGGEVAIFRAAEGGGNFTFMGNPGKFNALVEGLVG